MNQADHEVCLNSIEQNWDPLFGFDFMPRGQSNHSSLPKTDSFKIFCDKKWEESLSISPYELEIENIFSKIDQYSSQEKASTNFE